MFVSNLASPKPSAPCPKDKPPWHYSPQHPDSSRSQKTEAGHCDSTSVASPLIYSWHQPRHTSTQSSGEDMQSQRHHCKSSVTCRAGPSMIYVRCRCFNPLSYRAWSSIERPDVKNNAQSCLTQTFRNYPVQSAHQRTRYRTLSSTLPRHPPRGVHRLTLARFDRPFQTGFLCCIGSCAL
jgi:hypothetical protein